MHGCRVDICLEPSISESLVYERFKAVITIEELTFRVTHEE